MVFRGHLQHRNRRFDPLTGSALDPSSTNLIQKTLGIRQYLYPQSIVRPLIPTRTLIHNLTTSSVTLGIIGELALIHDATHTNDPTYDLCEITITEQIIQCVSIVTACWGQLKPFLTWLQSNGLRIQNADFANGYGYKSSLGSHSQSRSRDRRQDVQRASPSDRNEIVVTQDWEVGSQSSRAPVLRNASSQAEASGTRRSSDVIL